LLAEDNLPDALLVREVIRQEQLPLQIHLMPDGQRAMDFIERAESDPTAPHPHMLLVDINLPLADGFEVLRRLRSSESFRDILVLVMSSSDSPHDRGKAAELGAGYFRKPPSYQEFLKLGTLLKEMIERQKTM
jgi:CheY-like chemotaxis protein